MLTVRPRRPTPTRLSELSDEGKDTKAVAFNLGDTQGIEGLDRLCRGQLLLLYAE